MPSGSATPGSVVLSPEPRGRFIEGYLDTALFPGTLLSITTTAAKNGRFTYTEWATGFVPFIVLVEDKLQGRTVFDQYAVGEAAQLYIPLPGDELLLRAAANTYDPGEACTPGNGTGVIDSGAGSFRCIEAAQVVLAEENLLEVMVGAA